MSADENTICTYKHKSIHKNRSLAYQALYLTFPFFPFSLPGSTSSQEQFFSPHKQGENHGQGASRDAKDIDSTDGINYDGQDLRPNIGRQAPEERRASACDRSSHRVCRRARDDPDDLGGGLVEEDGVGDGERDGRSADLGASDETHGQGDLTRFDFSLRDGVGRLREGAAPDAEQDAVSVDLGGAGRLVDFVHQCGADDAEDSASKVPWHVIARFRHDGPVEHDGDDEKTDEGEKADTRIERGVSVYELEEQRNEVDGDEGGGDGAGRHGEEDEHRSALEELNGEDSSFFGGEDTEGLLDPEDDE